MPKPYETVVHGYTEPRQIREWQTEFEQESDEPTQPRDPNEVGLSKQAKVADKKLQSRLDSIEDRAEAIHDLLNNPPQFSACSQPHYDSIMNKVDIDNILRSLTSTVRARIQTDINLAKTSCSTNFTPSERAWWQALDKLY